MNSVYSLHGFIFPFTWEGSFDAVATFGNGSEENIWEEVVDSDIARCVSQEEFGSVTRYKREYDSVHYYTGSSRELVSESARTALKNCFKVKDKFFENGRLKYIITKGGKSYRLELIEIGLYIYSTGVGILKALCANKDYRSCEDVKNINEYGRRLALPFWPSCDGYFKCADKLEISGDEIITRHNCRDDFKGFTEAVNGKPVSFRYISRVVRGLLDCNGQGVKFRAKSVDDKNHIKILAPGEEKMYVCCLIIDSGLADSLKADYNREINRFDGDAGVSLWELAFCETEGQGKEKYISGAGDKLHDGLYTDDLCGRSPKLSATTSQAYVKIISQPDFDVEYFKNIYISIVVLVLAQRVSLAKFSIDINDILSDIQLKKTGVTSKTTQHIISLQERFVSFKNSYLPLKVTEKTEGRYLYDILRSDLDIVGECSLIDGQLTTLHEMISTKQGDLISKWGLIISVLATLFSLIGHIMSVKDFTELTYFPISAIIILVSEILLSILLIKFILKNKRGKKNE